MGKKLEFMKISKKENLTDVQNKVCRRLTKTLVEDGRKSDLPDFECSFDDLRLYQFQWIEKWNGFGCYVAFVEGEEIDRFTRENKEFAEGLGFDPLNPGGFEVNAEVYVYSPNSFPTKGLSSLLLNKADIVLVTTNDILSKYRGSFSEEGIKKLKCNNLAYEGEKRRRCEREEIEVRKIMEDYARRFNIHDSDNDSEGDDQNTD